ncbi:MAG: tRNA (adenosine(37)-N6)-dimethylallyltransferase MiaA, partial [Rhizobiales bacterium]|nr:tRNA (adenosine(37)-N6)-dimethylallyltransferase MiaA [Hyphomicrobiales bacterium]
ATSKAQLPGAAMRIVVAPPRALLHQRIEARAAQMIEQGAVEEVRALMSLGLDSDLPVMKAIGVREIATVIDGTGDLETALAAMCTSTRRYAKRQLTWARQRMADWRWVEDGGDALEEARVFLAGAAKG